MEIRKATTEDLPQLMEIFARARRFMAQTGNPTQWKPDYPGRALIEQQIARGVCHVCTEQGSVEGTFCLIFGPDPTYAVIEEGAWLDDAPYATIHRLASAGRVHGIAETCIRWCAGQSHTLRADTHADNQVMQHLLEKNGFIRCGIIHVADGSPRLAYWRGEPSP